MISKLIIINKSANRALEKGLIISNDEYIEYVDPRNINLGAKIVSKIENAQTVIKNLELVFLKGNYFFKNNRFPLSVELVLDFTLWEGLPCFFYIHDSSIV